MTKNLVVLLTAAAVLGAAGCSSSTTPEDLESLVGSWSATEAMFTSAGDPGTSVEVIAEGTTMVLTLNDSTFTLTITEPGEDPEVAEGTWSASAEIITLDWTSGFSGETQFEYDLDGDTLTLSGGHVEFEFTPGSPEEAILDMILVRL